jgi:hypothetical protein
MSRPGYPANPRTVGEHLKKAGIILACRRAWPGVFRCCRSLAPDGVAVVAYLLYGAILGAFYTLRR